MPTRVLQSVRGRRIRVTRLDPCGVPIDDGCSVVVSSGFIGVTITGNITNGRTYESRDIWGNLCIADADPDEMTSARVEIDLCDVNPDLLMVMTGRAPVLYDGEAIGFREGAGRNWDAYSLEVWTRNIADCNTWGYLLVPYVRNGRMTGAVTIENAPLQVAVEGAAFPSYGWGVGPHGDEPFRAEFVDGDIYGMVVTNVDPPADQDLSLCPQRLIDGARFRIDACESETLSA